jgi:hypothetical protein
LFHLHQERHVCARRHSSLSPRNSSVLRHWFSSSSVARTRPIADRGSGVLLLQANRLIDRDNHARGQGKARLAIAALTHNVATPALLRRAGLSADDFDSRRNRISAASQFKLFEYAAEVMDDSAFGLHLAEGANPREAGLLFYVMSAANDVGEAMALFARYSRIVNEALHSSCALRRGSSSRPASLAFPGTAPSKLQNLASPWRSRRYERSQVGISIRRT